MSFPAEIPDDISKQIELQLVETLDEVLEAALVDPPQPLMTKDKPEDGLERPGHITH